MVEESAKKGETETPVEEVGHPSHSSDSEGEKTASGETASHSKVIPDDEVKRDDRDAENGQVAVDDQKTNDKEAAKRSRREPKKLDSSETPVKKAKKERSSPVRTSARVKNLKAGIKLEKTGGLPEPKRSQSKRL